MTGSDFLCSMLALRAWNDGGAADGLNGALAVAFVQRNRVRSGWESGNWNDVLRKHHQWSATSEHYPDDIPDPTRNFAFSTLISEVGAVFNGTKEDRITVSSREIPTGYSSISLGAPPPVSLYYGRLNMISNPWFLEEISRNVDKHKLIAQVGSLSFWT